MKEDEAIILMHKNFNWRMDENEMLIINVEKFVY